MSMLKNLITRSLSGIVFVIIVIGSVLMGSVTFSSLMLVASLIGLYEYTKFRPDTFQNRSDKIILLISGFLLFIILWLVHSGKIELKYLSFVAVIFLVLTVRILLQNMPGSITKISEFIFGLIYIVLPFFFMITFYTNDYSNKTPELLIGFFIILWFNDVFAYLVGSLIGKTKLYENVSPKKTWEGTIGGMILSILSAYLISLFFLSVNLINWLAIGFLISIFATLGDLTESMFKRQANMKDSGNIMPGHGGVLDRFDGLLLAAPAVYFYLTIWG